MKGSKVEQDRRSIRGALHLENALYPPLGHPRRSSQALCRRRDSRPATLGQTWADFQSKPWGAPQWKVLYLRPWEVCEQALAHSLPDKVEAAHRRGDLLDKRVLLMHAWAQYCMTVTAADSVD